MTNSLASIGLALFVVLQYATEDAANATEPPTSPLNAASRVGARDDDQERPRSRQPARLDAARPERRSSTAPRRVRRDATDEATRVGDSEADAADERPRLRDQDAADKPPRRRRADSDTADRPRLRDLAPDRHQLRDREDRGRDRKRVTVVVRLKYVPAKDVAVTIAEWLDLEKGRTGEDSSSVVDVVVTNSLVISGFPDQVEQINRVVRELDQPPAQIRIKAVLLNLVLPETADLAETGALKGDISEIVAKLAEQGEMCVLAQSELLASDNQPAFVLVGNRVARVTGATVSSRGRTNKVEHENVGTTLGITGRVADGELVTLEIDVERSQLGSEREGTPVATDEDGSVVRTPQVETFTVQTTATLRSGETAVLGGLITKDDRGQAQVVVLVQPTIIKP